MTVVRFSYACLRGGKGAHLHITVDRIDTLCGRTILKTWDFRARKVGDKICETCLKVDLNMEPKK